MAPRTSGRRNTPNSSSWPDAVYLTPLQNLAAAGLRLVYPGYSSGHQRWGGVDEETEQVSGAVAERAAACVRGRGEHPLARRIDGALVRVDTQHGARIGDHDAQPRRPQPPHPAWLGLTHRGFDEVEYGAEPFGVIARGQPCDETVEHQVE